MPAIRKEISCFYDCDGDFHEKNAVSLSFGSNGNSLILAGAFNDVSYW